MGTALVADPRVRLISFTGGVETGEQIARQAGIKKLSMELGSNSPVIVQPDANLDAGRCRRWRAARSRRRGRTVWVSSACSSTRRSTRRSEACSSIAWRGSSPDRRSTRSVDVCAMINEAPGAAARVLDPRGGGAGRARARRRATRGRAPLADGARKRSRPARGWIAKRPTARWCRSTATASLDEAIERANDVRYGLHAAIFTESLRDAFTAVQRLVGRRRHRERLDRLSAGRHAVRRHEVQRHRTRRCSASPSRR